MVLPMLDRHQNEGRDDALRVACEGAMLAALGELPRDEDQFNKAVKLGKGELFRAAEHVAKGLDNALREYSGIVAWVEKNQEDRNLGNVAEDIAEELEWLTHGGFIWRAGYDRIRDYGRYFQAIEERLRRLESLPLAKDEEKMRRVRRIWHGWFLAWQKEPDNTQLWQLGWMLEEMRVMEFAPNFPKKTKVSLKKIEETIQRVIN